MCGRARLVQCIALAGLPQAAAGQAALLHALTSSLRAGGTTAQAAAAAALGALTRAYPLEEADKGSGAGAAGADTRGLAQAAPASRAGAGAVEVVTLGFVDGLGDAGAAVRRGSAAALGALPARLLRPAAPAVLGALSAAALVRAVQ